MRSHRRESGAVWGGPRVQKTGVGDAEEPGNTADEEFFGVASSIHHPQPEQGFCPVKYQSGISGLFLLINAHDSQELKIKFDQNSIFGFVETFLYIPPDCHLLGSRWECLGGSR
jgi:hypothetical protein